MITVQPNRLPLVLAVVGAIFCVGAILHQALLEKPTSKANGVAESAQSSFYDIAMSHGTDKVADHGYHRM